MSLARVILENSATCSFGKVPMNVDLGYMMCIEERKASRSTSMEGEVVV